MSNNLVVLCEEIIDTIMRNVDDEDQRAEIYDEMIQPFVTAGVEDFVPLLGFDPIFDRVFLEHFPDAEIEE